MINNNMTESVTQLGPQYASLLYNQNSEDEQILPQQLSGDENAQRNAIVQSNAFSYKKASLFMSVTILMKTVIGVGILSLPFVFSTMGIIPTIITFFLTGVLTRFAANLLIKSKNLSGHSNYSSIMRHLHNHKNFKILAGIILMSGPLGACIIDLMFFKRTFRKLLTDVLAGNPALDEFYTSEYMIVLVVSVIQFPMTLLNKIEKLKVFTFIGILGIFIFIVAFIIDFSIKISNNEGLRTLQLFPSDIYQAISTVPNIIFSLAFNTNFFPIFKGLQSSSDKRMIKVVTIGLSACVLFYMTIGFLGYSITKDTISSNFLESIKFQDTNQVLFFLMNSGFLASLLLAFPVVFFSCRNNFILIFKTVLEKQQVPSKWREDKKQIQNQSPNASQILKKKAIYTLYTSALFIIIVLVSMFVNNIQSVFNLVGAVSASAVGFILPMYFYIKLIYKKNKQKKGIYYLSIVLFFVMILLCIFSVVALYI